MLRSILWNKSIFSRLLTTFILIMLPIFILGFNIYNWGLNSIKYELETSMQAKINSYAASFGNEVQRIMGLQYNMFSDPALTSLSLSSSNPDDYKINMDILRVQRGLEAIKTSSKYISEVSVCIPALGRVIKTSTVGGMDEYYTGLIKAYPDMPEFGLCKWGDSIILIKGFPDLDQKQFNLQVLFIVVELSKNEFGEMLQEMQVYKGSGAFIFNSKDDIFIFKGADEKVGYAIKNNIKNTFGIADDISRKFTAKVENEKYLATYSESDLYDFSLVMYTPEKVLFERVNQYKVLFIMFIIAAMVIIVIFSFSVYKFVHRPLSKLAGAFVVVENGDMTVEINHKGKDEFGFIYNRFNTMVKGINSLIDQVYRQKILVQKAELKQLQAQINPHFLYNSFHTLQRWMSLGYIEDSIKFARQLGNYFQFVTRNCADEIPLKNEVMHARTYAEIQALRFSNRIEVDFQQLPAEFEGVIVPRLILQPVIENSFEHALEDMEKNGILSVSFEKSGDFLSINVEDNGRLITDSRLLEMSESLNRDDLNMEITGIINIHRRICLKFGPKSGITLSIGSHGGLRVTLNIELKEDIGNVFNSDC